MSKDRQRNPHDAHEQELKTHVAAILEGAIPAQQSHAKKSTTAAPGVRLVGHRNTVYVGCTMCPLNQARRLQRPLDWIERIALVLFLLFAGFKALSWAINALELSR